jgi:hypothetical protein
MKGTRSETFRNETARQDLALNYQSLETFRSPSLSFIDFQKTLAIDLLIMPVPVAARSKEWVYGRSPAEIVGSNTAGGKNVCLL